MKIEFYIPKDEMIPTRLRVKVDETIDVYYKRLPNEFGFKFDFFKFYRRIDGIVCFFTIFRFEYLIRNIEKFRLFCKIFYIF